MLRRGALGLSSAVAAVIALAIACVWVTVYRTDQSLADQRTRVAQMDAATKRHLQQVQKRFAALGAEQQEELRRLHEQIEQSPDREQLLQVMQRYYQWLETVTPYERLELRRMAPAERLARVKETVERQRERQAHAAEFFERWRNEMARRLLPPELSPEDLDAVLGWMKKFAGQDSRVLLSYVPEDRREDMAKALDHTKGDLQERLHLLGWLWLRWQLDHPHDPLPLEQIDLAALVDSLSEPTRARLRGLAAEQQKKILASAVRFVVAGSMVSRAWRQAPPVFDERELVAFLEGRITPEQRDQLWRMSPGERRQGLWWAFLQSKMPELSPGQPGGPPFGFGPGSGRPRGPGLPRGFRRPEQDDMPPHDGSHRPPPPRNGPPATGPLMPPLKVPAEPPDARSAPAEPATEHSEPGGQTG